MDAVERSDRVGARQQRHRRGECPGGGDRLHRARLERIEIELYVEERAARRERPSVTA